MIMACSKKEWLQILENIEVIKHEANCWKDSYHIEDAGSTRHMGPRNVRTRATGCAMVGN
jgi:hypothetical protein